VSNGELKEDEYMPSAQSPEVLRSKPGGSGVCKDRTKKKGQTQPQQVPKASNSCLQVHKHPMMPKRNKVAHKTKTHAFTNIPSSYVLRRNNLRKVVATYVGNQSNIYVKRSL
jgi:hypothetical protein